MKNELEKLCRGGRFRRKGGKNFFAGLPPRTPVRTHTPVSRYSSSPPSTQGLTLIRPPTTTTLNSKVLSERGGAGQRVGYTKTGLRASPNRITQNHETYGLHLRFTRRAGTHLSRTTINVNGTVERKTNVKPCEVQSSKADKAENVSHSAHPAHTPRVRSSPMVASALSKR